MGGLTKALFGGSSQKSGSTQTSTSTSSSNSTSESGNKAYDYLLGLLGGNVKTGGNAMASMGALLGQGGDPAAAKSAFDAYLGSTGYNFMMDQGSHAITGNNAAKGLLNSGSTLKALNTYGQNTGAQYFNNYLGQLQNLVANGNQSAGLISGAGGYSNSTSNSTSNSMSNGSSYGNGSSQNGIIPGLFG